jgi:hypothetical protein
MKGMLMRKFPHGRFAGSILLATSTAAVLISTYPASAATPHGAPSGRPVVTTAASTARPAALTELRQVLDRQPGVSPAKVRCWSNVGITSVANQRYVSAELGYSQNSPLWGMLRARATQQSLWEQFFVCRDGASGMTNILSQRNNRYVSAELNYAGNTTGMLRARATIPSAWENFTTSAPPGGNVTTIRSVQNGLYVATEGGYTGDLTGLLRTRPTPAVTSQQRFVW